MKESVFQGRSLLAEKDFTKEELQYLIDFSEHLKDLKKRGIPHHYLEGKILRFYLKNIYTYSFCIYYCSDRSRCTS